MRESIALSSSVALGEDGANDSKDEFCLFDGKAVPEFTLVILYGQAYRCSKNLLGWANWCVLKHNAHPSDCLGSARTVRGADVEFDLIKDSFPK